MENFNNTIPQDDLQRIVKEFEIRKVKQHCPMCSNNSLTIVPQGYFNNSIQNSLDSGIVLGGPSIPTIGVICNNCGYLSQYSLGVLGLLNK